MNSESKLGAFGLLVAITSCVLMFLCMSFPMVTSLLGLKAFMFAIILVTVPLEFAIVGRSSLDRGVYIWGIGLATLSFFLVVEGFFRGTPGARTMALVYVLWPLVYLVWMAGMSRRAILAGIERTALVATWFIGLYGCAYFLTKLGFLPETRLMSALSMDWEFESFGSNEGYTGMAFPGLNSLPFLLPYLMARVAMRVPSQDDSLAGRLSLWGALGLGLAVTLAASRRALMLVVMLTPVLVLLLRLTQPLEERELSKRSFGFFWKAFLFGTVAIFLALGLVYQFELTSFWERFRSAFDFTTLSTDELGGGAVRREQFFALVRGWFDSPLFGAGHGSTAAAYGSIRSETMPWAYELSYLALLYQIGLVGLSAYAAGVVWVFRRGATLVRKGGDLGRMAGPMLVGLVGVLIAHAVDPYLDRFDGMWMFFLPLAVINYGLTRERAGEKLRIGAMVQAAGLVTANEKAG